MTNKLRTRRVGVLAALMTVALGATACGGSDAPSDEGSEAAAQSITLGIIPSWTDGLSTAYLWENILEAEGIDVEIQELSEAAPLYTGLSNGDVDVYPSGWSEATHAEYMEEYGDDIEDLGAYYDNAKLTFAVPEYTDIDSIADLTGNADMFDGRIVGIEPGAGLTAVTKDSVMPTYGLEEDYELVESSTTAMLTELQSAVDAEEDIVVTLWKPFWANSSFPLKDLEDPEAALGPVEGLHTLARTGFTEDFPEIAEMMTNFKLDDDQYGQLENLVVNEFGSGQEAEAVEQWLEENPDFIDGLKG
ncbi:MULTISPECIES: glycine betaine ABC transporter substrate-binding protein [unclassified Arthrobacter]|uniref:glycine betaine ABC transporter substrate-binding protein n=1 Tax=unclassified Arthrobacter TaxID=235627 RepID=UPI0002E4422F|nr:MULTISPECIES: glycine betaine ABC transporter substrate-binding protein [unclassified Arthrobacter]